MTLLVLMTDEISEGSGEHVCLHNLVRVLLGNKDADASSECPDEPAHPRKTAHVYIEGM